MTAARPWKAAECAAHLGYCTKYFLRVVRWREGFPSTLPSFDGARPRWDSEAVKAWSLRQSYAKAA